MYLYYFNPNDYGGQWFVAAADKQAAIDAVRRSIHDTFATGCRQRDRELVKYRKEYADNDNAYQSFVRGAHEGNSRESEWMRSQLNELDCAVRGVPHYSGATVMTIDRFPVGHAIGSEIS